MSELALLVAASLLFCVPAHAQEFEGHQQLAEVMAAGNWTAAQHATTLLLGDPNETRHRDMLECMHALLTDRELRDPQRLGYGESLGEHARFLSSATAILRSLTTGYAECLDSPPAGLDVEHAMNQQAIYASLFGQATTLSEAASAASQPSDCTGASALPSCDEPAPEALRHATAAFLNEFPRRLAQDDQGDEDDQGERAARLYAQSHPPEAVSGEPFRSDLPLIMTSIATAFFVAGGLRGSIHSASSGRPLPYDGAGSWGLALGLIPALLSSATWRSPTLPLLVLSTSMTALTLGAGAFALTSESENTQIFGWMLGLGSLVSAGWLAVGWALYASEQDRNEPWQEYVSFAATPSSAMVIVRGPL